MALTHVLFDLDGVLLDTEPLYSRATQAIVGRFGKTFDWSIKRRIMGSDARVGATYLLEQLGIPLSADEFLAQQRPILEELLANAPAMPGVETFVRGLAARKVPMAVATSSARHLFDLKSARHSFFEAFEAIVCGDDPRVSAKKPSPQLFLVAALELRAAPASCLVFEDSPAGVTAALAAGMRVVAIPDPELGIEHCAGAHRILPDWNAISAIGFDRL